MTELAEISELLRARLGQRTPFIVGITGAVAVGKSTFAGELAATIAAWPQTPSVEVVSTDGFLFLTPCWRRADC
jgi:type I pantothenate kinase